MKTSKKQFDDLFKQKLSSINFEPTPAAQEALLKQIKKDKNKLVKKTWGKLSLVLLMVSTFVLLQHKVQYRSVANFFQSQSTNSTFAALQSLNFAPAIEPVQKSAAQPKNNAIQLLVAELQAAAATQPKELWESIAAKNVVLEKPQLKAKARQLAPPIAKVFKFEGTPLFESAASANQTIICGQNKAHTKLIIAQSKVAKFDTDSTVNETENGVFRPTGFDQNAVIQYNIFDKRTLFRRFHAESIHWGLVRTTKIAKPVKTKDTTTGNQIDSDPHIHGTRQYIEPEYEEYNYNVKNDSIIFISDRVNYVVMMEPSGTILSKAQIEITEPFVYYLGEKRALFDAATGKVYICVATLYHFNFYELEPANGQTNFLMQLNDVWPNPNFQIENGKLSYFKNNIGYQQLL
ncbi:MAG: hypothetical protein RL331_239 [Bacteroidota bacterium]|jgi:hypothetical protein